MNPTWIGAAYLLGSFIAGAGAVEVVRMVIKRKGRSWEG